MGRENSREAVQEEGRMRSHGEGPTRGSVGGDMWWWGVRTHERLGRRGVHEEPCKRTNEGRCAGGETNEGLWRRRGLTRDDVEEDS